MYDIKKNYECVWNNMYEKCEHFDIENSHNKNVAYINNKNMSLF